MDLIFSVRNKEDKYLDQGVYSDLMDCPLDRKMISRSDSTKHNYASVTHIQYFTSGFGGSR